MAEGYSMSGSQANSVALKPAGTFRGGKRFSVCGPVRGGSPPARVRSPRSNAPPAARRKRLKRARLMANTYANCIRRIWNRSWLGNGPFKLGPYPPRKPPLVQPVQLGGYRVISDAGEGRQ